MVKLLALFDHSAKGRADRLNPGSVHLGEDAQNGRDVIVLGVHVDHDVVVEDVRRAQLIHELDRFCGHLPFDQFLNTWNY